MSKITIVYQDTHGRCRILVNPENLDKYLGKDNVAINPPIESLLAHGATPDRWYIEGGQIHVRDTKEKTEDTKLDVYDLFCDVMDKKQEMSKWIDEKQKKYERLSNRIVLASSRLDRLDRFLNRFKRRAIFSVIILSALFIYALVSAWLVG